MQEYIIDLWGLRSPAAIYQGVVPKLQSIYLDDPASFREKRIVWDFRGLEPRQINAMALPIPGSC